MHQVELAFECRFDEVNAGARGPLPDVTLTGVAWLPSVELKSYRFYTSVLRSLLRGALCDVSAVSLGDVGRVQASGERDADVE